MCFISESDWYAAICEINDAVASCKSKCDECRCVIEINQFMHTIYMQEHEECQACADGDCQCDMNGDEPICVADGCQCVKPDFGETFDYKRCEQCHKFIAAVRAAEIAEGCGASEAVPSLEMMREEINNGGMKEAKRYFKAAKRLYPELAASGYLGKLWCSIF